MIWYAAYGSNLDRERFLRYLTGGRPLGSTVNHRGARNPDPPRAERAAAMPYPLYFRGSSRTWGGGGVAFVDSSPKPAVAGEPTLVRQYLITDEQFVDVLGQECGLDPQEAAELGGRIDWPDVIAEGSADVCDAAYGRLLCPEVLDGVAVVTFTNPAPRDLGADRAPSAAYRSTIERGLRQLGLSPTAAARYLDARISDGVSGGISDGISGDSADD